MRYGLRRLDSPREEVKAQEAPAATRDWKRVARLWAFALVPAWGLFELGAHVKQTRSVVPEADWKAAKQAVQEIVQPADLVVFAPRWSDPLGREYFGDAITTFEREARPDESRFPRAIEVSIRGKHTPELAGWRNVGERKVGAITITTLENPAPAKVIDDLLNHVDHGPRAMTVQRIDGARESECNWTEGQAQTGGLGFGPAVPAHRFTCPGGNFVGISIIHDLDNRPRRCFYASPAGGSVILRARFSGVSFGQELHGHVGLQQESERDRVGAPVTVVWKSGDKMIGRVVHVDGDGWKGFEFSTADLAGQKGDLTAEISAPNGKNRQFCFEADTR